MQIMIDETGRVRFKNRIKMSSMADAMRDGVFAEKALWGENNESHRQQIMFVVRLFNECAEIITTLDYDRFRARCHLLPLKARVLRTAFVLLTDNKADKWSLRGLSDWTQWAVKEAMSRGEPYAKGSEEVVEKKHAVYKGKQARTPQCGGTKGTAANQAGYLVQHSKIFENDSRLFPDMTTALNSVTQSKQRQRHLDRLHNKADSSQVGRVLLAPSARIHHSRPAVWPYPHTHIPTRSHSDTCTATARR
jgi:hypothetical protein